MRRARALRSCRPPRAGPGALERGILVLHAYGARDADGTARRAGASRRRRDGWFDGRSTTAAFSVLALRAAGRSAPADAHGPGGGALARRARANRDGGLDGRRAALGRRRHRRGDRSAGLGGAARASEPCAAALSFLARPRTSETAGSPLQPGPGSDARSTAWAVQRPRRRPSRPDGRTYLAGLTSASGAISFSRSSTQTPVWVTGEARRRRVAPQVPFVAERRGEARRRARHSDSATRPRAASAGGALSTTPWVSAAKAQRPDEARAGRSRGRHVHGAASSPRGQGPSDEHRGRDDLRRSTSGRRPADALATAAKASAVTTVAAAGSRPSVHGSDHGVASHAADGKAERARNAGAGRTTAARTLAAQHRPAAERPRRPPHATAARAGQVVRSRPAYAQQRTTERPEDRDAIPSATRIPAPIESGRRPRSRAGGSAVMRARSSVRRAGADVGARRAAAARAGRTAAAAVDQRARHDRSMVLRR